VTYIPMRSGFLYLVAIMDWFSRKVLAWRLSNTMDADFCVTALEEAIVTGLGLSIPLASSSRRLVLLSGVLGPKKENMLGRGCAMPVFAITIRPTMVRASQIL
jgi:hypothetical protein